MAKTLPSEIFYTKKTFPNAPLPTTFSMVKSFNSTYSYPASGFEYKLVESMVVSLTSSSLAASSKA